MDSRWVEVFSNWDEAVGSVVRGSSALIGTYDTAKPSPGLAASRERVTGTVAVDDEKTMLSWFFDWNWVHRRVENIRVLDNAQTRRHFSFDVELPFSPELRRFDHDGYPTGQVNVPLTFLRRGMLVNLDIRDSEGRPMLTITSSENLTITYRAVKQLTDRVKVAELMRQMVEADQGEDADQDGKPPTPDYDQIVDDAILSLINTHGMDRGHFNNRTVDRHQEDHRHQLFEALGQIVHSLQPAEKSAEAGCAAKDADTESDPVVVRLPKMLKTDAEQGYVLDTSPPVNLLACTILFASNIDKKKDASDISDKITLLDLELLCVLLAIVSYSYLLCIVADESEMWRIPGHGAEKDLTTFPAESQEGAPAPVGRRTVVKLACDVEPDDIPLNIFNPTRKVLIRYSQTTARSTHLEFSPPENAVAQSITSPVVIHRNSPEDPEFPVEQVTFGTESSAGAEHPVGPRGTDMNRDGFYRASQSRVHVEPPLSRTDPVRTLRIALTPEQRWQAGTAATVAAVVVILCRLLWGDGDWGFPGNPFSKGKGGADNFNGNLSVFLALETLLTAVFGALFFTTGSHRLSRKVGGPSRFAIGLAWAAAALSPVGLLAEPYGAGLAHSLFWGGSLAALLLSAGGAGMISWSSRQPHGNVERIIRREGTGPWWERMFDSPVQDRRNVLAVTETGAFDCHYLTDPDHRQALTDRAHA